MRAPGTPLTPLHVSPADGHPAQDMQPTSWIISVLLVELIPEPVMSSDVFSALYDHALVHHMRKEEAARLAQQRRMEDEALQWLIHCVGKGRTEIIADAIDVVEGGAAHRPWRTPSPRLSPYVAGIKPSDGEEEDDSDDEPPPPQPCDPEDYRKWLDRRLKSKKARTVAAAHVDVYGRPCQPRYCAATKASKARDANATVSQPAQRQLARRVDPHLIDRLTAPLAREVTGPHGLAPRQSRNACEPKLTPAEQQEQAQRLMGPRREATRSVSSQGAPMNPAADHEEARARQRRDALAARAEQREKSTVEARQRNHDAAVQSHLEKLARARVRVAPSHRQQPQALHLPYRDASSSGDAPSSDRGNRDVVHHWWPDAPPSHQTADEKGTDPRAASETSADHRAPREQLFEDALGADDVAAAFDFV